MSTTFWLEYVKGRKLLEDPDASVSEQGPVAGLLNMKIKLQIP
jgi:hypothetical protein